MGDFLPKSLRFQLGKAKKNENLSVLCVERERVAKMRERMVCLAAGSEPREREREILAGK